MTALWSLAVAFLLVSLLLLVGLKGLRTARELEQESDASLGDRVEGGPPMVDLAERIFSPADWRFVSGLNIPELAMLFQRERKAVALLWVRHTSRGIRQVMRDHAEAARRSHNLEFRTELKLFRQYVELTLTCGVLYAAIQAGGPLWLRGLAIHAQELSQKIADAQANFRAAAESQA